MLAGVGGVEAVFILLILAGRAFGPRFGMLLGAVLVSIADTVGRTVIAPAQIPAGLVTAMVGTPYFVWLLWRSRARA